MWRWRAHRQGTFALEKWALCLYRWSGHLFIVSAYSPCVHVFWELNKPNNSPGMTAWLSIFLDAEWVTQLISCLWLPHTSSRGKNNVFILNRYHSVQIHHLMNMAMSVVPHLPQKSNGVQSIVLEKACSPIDVPVKWTGSPSFCKWYFCFMCYYSENLLKTLMAIIITQE